MCPLSRTAWYFSSIRSSASPFDSPCEKGTSKYSLARIRISSFVSGMCKLLCRLGSGVKVRPAIILSVAKMIVISTSRPATGAQRLTRENYVAITAFTARSRTGCSSGASRDGDRTCTSIASRQEAAAPDRSLWRRGLSHEKGLVSTAALHLFQVSDWR